MTTPAAQLDFNQFQCLTFDCYGTLIDWETGLLAALQAVFSPLNPANGELLTAYSELEPSEQGKEYCKYREVLGEVMRGLSQRYGFPITAEQEASLAESIPGWQPFPDTVDALRRLKTKYKLAVISNIDDDLFAHTAKHLEMPFDYVITAQQAGSYKPSLNNFHTALQRIGLPKSSILHVAESLYHDIVPTRQLGIANVWVNRRGDKATGATRTADITPDLTVTSVGQLADIMV